MKERWIVQVEIVSDEHVRTGGLALDTLLEELADCSPGVLWSPDRFALVLHVSADSALDAHLLAQDAVGRVVVPEWRMVRVELLSADEFERECRSAEREEGLPLPSSARGNDSLADHLLRNVFEDPVTHLPTGEAFRAHLHQALDRLQPPGRRHAVLVVNVEAPPCVVAGTGQTDDLALIEVADRVASTVRRGDMLARLAPDTLALLVKDVQEEDVIGLAQRALDILTEVQGSPGPSGREGRVSGSIGVALSDFGSDADRLLARALAAMDVAKSGGGGRFELFRSELAQPAPPGTGLRPEHPPDPTDDV